MKMKPPGELNNLAYLQHSDKLETFKIRATNSSYCPMLAVLKFCELRGMAPGYLFVNKNGKELTREFIADHLKDGIKRLGMKVGRYNTHSFRIGRASDMAAQGVPEQVIK